MEALNYVSWIIRDKVIPIFPITRERKEEFLDIVRQKVSYYKPLIEEKCNLDLGDIQVKDNNEFTDDIVDYSLSRDLRKLDFVPNKFVYNLLKSYLQARVAIQLWQENLKSASELRHWHGVIIVPFYYQNRKDDLKNRALMIDEPVVHELSHKLWDKISGDNMVSGDNINIYTKEQLKSHKEWSEGFASYCSNIRFNDLYPAGTKKPGLSLEYELAMNRVKWLIFEHGEDVLFEIPKRWLYFSENNTLEKLEEILRDVH